MKKGSYTVEAALLMGILLPLLTGLIGTGVFLKVRAECYGKALEEACWAALLGEDQEYAVVEDTEIKASVSQSVPVFPMVNVFFEQAEKVTASCILERKNPAETVFRMRSLKRVIRQVIE